MGVDCFVVVGDSVGVGGDCVGVGGDCVGVSGDLIGEIWEIFIVLVLLVQLQSH